MVFSAVEKCDANPLSLRSIIVCFVAAVTACAGSSGKAQDSQRSSNHSLLENPMRRAGNPMCVAPWARPFPDSKYTGYYTGGGAALYGSPATAFRGEYRCINEGTFGVDYAPWYSRVRTQWFHGRKQQGGEGQYEPDGRNHPMDDHLGFGPFRPAPRLFHH